MVWAAISDSDRTNLVHVQGNLTAQRYCHEIIRPHVIPFMNHRNVIFQHDNARLHTVRATTAFLTQNNVHVPPDHLDHQIRTPLCICGMSLIDVCNDVTPSHRCYKDFSRHLSKSGLPFSGMLSRL
ncbi:UNVERIFIED_CONTAM: hypothetical protein FKN15_009919 [Acipenser sinensis]